MKKYFNSAFIYAILAMVGGVFYREFTKFSGFTGKTTLSVVHTHYFVLGVVFFIILLLLEKNFAFTTDKTKKAIVIYHIGLNLTVAMFVVRGVFQTLGTALSAGLNASISGIAGVGHIILAVGIIMTLLNVKKAIK